MRCSHCVSTCIECRAAAISPYAISTGSGLTVREERAPGEDRRPRRGREAGESSAGGCIGELYRSESPVVSQWGEDSIAGRRKWGGHASAWEARFRSGDNRAASGPKSDESRGRVSRSPARERREGCRRSSFSLSSRSGLNYEARGRDAHGPGSVCIAEQSPHVNSPLGNFSPRRPNQRRSTKPSRNPGDDFDNSGSMRAPTHRGR